MRYLGFIARPGNECLRILETAIQQLRSQLVASDAQLKPATLEASAARQTASSTVTAKKIQPVTKSDDDF